MDIKKEILENLGEVKKNLLLLLTAKSNAPFIGKLWYQKELFLLSKNNKDLNEEAGFDAYLWGPHSELADSEMEEFVQLGVVKMLGSKYILTPLGMDIAKAIKSNKEEKELIEDVKNFLNDLSKDELLLFTYISYPEMCEESVEFKNLLPKRKDIAMNLYEKNKVSIGKAAEIAGISIDSMIKILKQNKLYKVEE